MSVQGGKAAVGDEYQPINSSHPSITVAAMEQKMREQIRLLQEHRAAVMMEEVIDLQRERDLALGRIKTLKKKMEDLTMENALLKGAVGRSDLTEKLISLERNCLEERLLGNDLRKKLQASNKQKEELMLKVRKIELESAATQSTLLNVNRQRDRSQSLTDLKENDVQVNNGTPRESSNSPPDHQADVAPETVTPTAKLPPSGRKFSPPLLVVSSGQVTPGVRSGTSTPLSYSPAVIPRRYKLAAATTRDCSTQTAPMVDSKNIVTTVTVNDQVPVPSDFITALEKAKKDIIALHEEKERMESDLNSVTSKRSKERAAYKKECALLHTESTVLKESLSEFSVWTRQKIQLFEEDMDIFKVVYSLHASLSQEKAMLNELREKLTKTESKIARLQSTNEQLQEELTHVEEKYKKCKKEIKRLHEKPLSTPPHYYSPSSQRQFRSYKSTGYMTDCRPSSPLLSKTSPPIKGMFPVKVANNQV